MKLTLFPLALLVLALAASSAQANWVNQDNYWALNCCARGKGCPWHVAKKSYVCRPHRWMSAQSWRCRQQACLYCKKSWRRRRLPECRSMAIQRNCFGVKNPKPYIAPKPAAPKPRPTMRPKPKPMAKPPPPPRKPGKCVFRGKNGRVWIPALAFPVKSPWVKKRNHIIWRPNGGTWIDKMGSGKACVEITVDQTGRYFLTARTAAPHVSEHNDMWMGFSAGLDLLRAEMRSFRTGSKDGTKMYKGYHPVSFNKETDQLYTIDHNPHQLITKIIYAGRKYQVCIAGRSSKFKIFSVIMVRCKGIMQCSYWSKDIKNKLSVHTPTKCT